MIISPTDFKVGKSHPHSPETLVEPLSALAFLLGQKVSLLPNKSNSKAGTGLREIISLLVSEVRLIHCLESYHTTLGCLIHQA